MVSNLKYQQRIIGLDILRSIAILLVVYGHGINILPNEYKDAYKQANFINLDGVSIFFVLSGFLIGGILLKTLQNNKFTIKVLFHFWIRRWFRTIPNYLLIIIFIIIYRHFFCADLGEFNISYFLFLQNFTTPHPSFFIEAWSLPIEEWFYILYPITCYLFYKLLKNTNKSILYSAILFIIFPVIMRIIKFELYTTTIDFDNEFRKIVLLRLDSIMYGVLGAYIQYTYTTIWTKYKYHMLFLGFTLYMLFTINPLEWKHLYPPLFFNYESIIVLCFLPILSSYTSTKIKAVDTFFIWISLLSYSMYLLNLTIIQDHIMPYIQGLCNMRNKPIYDTYITNYCMYWALTIVGSYLLYTIYERPMTNLRDKITVQHK